MGEGLVCNILFIRLLIVLWILELENFRIKTAKTLARKKGKGVPLSLFRCPVCQSADRVKRERVRVPDRPAAVNSFMRFMTYCIHCFVGRNGKDMKESKSEDLPVT